MSRWRAFIIGENGPSEEAITPLIFAERDASRLAAVLSSESLAYDIVHSGPCSAVEHLSRLDAFASDSERDDLLMVYFSGHGYLPRTGLYLLCGTSNLTRSLVTTAIPLSTIRAILENCKARTKILILDCCHSGAAGSNVWGTKSPLNQPGLRLDAETRDAASLVIAASERFSSARESHELGGGVMTSFLIEALEAPDGSDKDQDGRLSVADTMEWLRLRTREYNANRAPHEQVDIPILYGDLRGDVYLTPDLGTAPGARAAAAIHELVAEVRKLFSAERSPSIRTLQKLATSISIQASRLSSLSVVDDLLGLGDDAALYSAAIVVHTRRESGFAPTLIRSLGPHLREATVLRILRALWRIFEGERPDYDDKEQLKKALRAITQSLPRSKNIKFGPSTVFGKILALTDQLEMTPEEVFSNHQLARRLPGGAGGKLRQWNGKIRLYYDDKDCRLPVSSYTTFIDFVDDVYERLRAEGSLITSYGYGIDWILEAKGSVLPRLGQSDPTTLLDLGLRDDERVKFVQLASVAKLESRRASTT
jgi:hypothetical protein